MNNVFFQKKIIYKILINSNLHKKIPHFIIQIFFIYKGKFVNLYFTHY